MSRKERYWRIEITATRWNLVRKRGTLDLSLQPESKTVAAPVAKYRTEALARNSGEHDAPIILPPAEGWTDHTVTVTRIKGDDPAIKGGIDGRFCTA